MGTSRAKASESLSPDSKSEKKATVKRDRDPAIRGSSALWHAIAISTAQQPGRIPNTPGTPPKVSPFHLGGPVPTKATSGQKVAPTSSISSSGLNGVAQRQEAEMEEQELLQGKFTTCETPAQGQGDGAAAESRTGMPGSLKKDLEALSGMNLSGIRVHHNSSKPFQLNALAYTQGQDIHVGPGQEKHLPHEGWHAVQQMQGRVKPTVQAKGVSINDDAGLEREADVMGAKALQTRRAGQAATNPMAQATTAESREKEPTEGSKISTDAIGPSEEKGRLKFLSTVQRKEDKKERKPKLNYDYIEYETWYDQAAQGWNFIKDKQILAIDSIYTEAKKPRKPSLLEELLIGLAIAALAGAVNVLGTIIATKIASRAKRLAQDRFKAKWGKPTISASGKQWYHYKNQSINEDYAKQLFERTENLAKLQGEFFKDTFKSGIKRIAEPTLKELIMSGQQPIDAFFEGQKLIVVDAAKEAYDKEMKNKPSVFKEEADPIAVAQANKEARDQSFANALDVQKENTLKAWLLFQARSVLGVTKNNLTDVSSIQSGKEINVPGVIVVSGEITSKGELNLNENPILPGLTDYLRAQFKNEKIAKLGFPIHVRIYNQYLVANVGVNWNQNFFKTTIDESGNTWQSQLTSTTKRGLAAVGRKGSNRGHGSFPAGVPASKSEDINDQASSGIQVIEDYVSLINSDKLKARH